MVGALIYLLPIIAIFIFAFQGYKTAGEYDRSPIGWAIAIFGTGLVLQIMVPFILMVLFGIIVTVSGEFGAALSEYLVGISILIWIVGVIGSFAAMMFLLNKAGTEKTVDGSSTTPPAPPAFS